MSNLLPCLLLALTAAQPLPRVSRQIILVSPKGNERWLLGTTQTIAWKASGVQGEVRITLEQAGWNLGHGTIVRVPASAGSFAWTVGKLAPGYASLTGPGAGFRVRVATLDGKVVGESPQPFRIDEMPTARTNARLTSSPKTLTVTSPMAGATWERLGTYDVLWQQSRNLDGAFARIHLLKSNGGLAFEIAAKRPLKPGRHNFQLPGVSDVPALQEGDYRIRIETVGGEARGESGLFRIVPAVKYSSRVFPATTKNGSHIFMSDGTHETSKGGPVVEGLGAVKVGFMNNFDDPKQTSITYRSVISFDLQGLKGKVKWAKLTYQKNDGTPDGARPIWALAVPWDGSSMGMWGIAGTAVDLLNVNQMKAVVQGWIDDPTMNFGFLMAGPDESMARNTSGHVMILSGVKLEIGIDAIH